MADGGPLSPDSLSERRSKAVQRRTMRRRVAALLIVAAVAVLVTVLVAGGGGGGRHGPEGGPARATGAAKKRGAAPARRAVAPTQSHAGWIAHKGPVPILMYHVIDKPTPGAPYPDLFVDPDVFAAQVKWLDTHGYQGVTLNQVENAWWQGAKLPPKPIVLSFDDGYLGQYTNAMPDLQRLGWPGVLDLKAQGSDLSDGEVSKMIAAGWELASHTISHLDLTTLGATALKREVRDSRQILRKRFGVPVENFCYPAGRYNSAVVAAVRQAGYRGATTVDPGLAVSSEPFTLKRVRVDRSDGVSGLALKLGQAG